MTNRDCAVLAFRLLVVWFLATALIGLTLFGISRHSWRTVLGPESYTDDQRALIWSAAAKANTVAGAVRLLMGVGLVLGPARLAEAAAHVRREFRGSLEEDESPGTAPGVPPPRGPAV